FMRQCGRAIYRRPHLNRLSASPGLVAPSMHDLLNGVRSTGGAICIPVINGFDIVVTRGQRWSAEARIPRRIQRRCEQATITLYETDRAGGHNTKRRRDADRESHLLTQIRWIRR